MEDHNKILKKAADALREVAVKQQAWWRQEFDAADPVRPVEALRKVAETFEIAPDTRPELALHWLSNLTKDDVDRVRKLPDLLRKSPSHDDEHEIAKCTEMAKAIAAALDLFGPIDEQLAVLQALSNPEYEWRTIDGVSRETGLDPANVSRLVRGLRHFVLRSRIPDDEGRDLYTTREHYRKTQGPLSRILNQYRST